MPEGDTVFRAAQTLHRFMAGQTVTRFESVYPLLTRVVEDHPLIGRTIVSVSARGKHLLMSFTGGLVLRTHLKMNGSWHIYPAGERWQRPARDMRVVVATVDFVAVAFSVPVAEIVRASALDKHRPIALLGPDLLGEEFDRDEALRRLRAHPASEIADALLNQRIAAGIGNVYKSEVLFSCRVNPFATVAALSDAQLR